MHGSCDERGNAEAVSQYGTSGACHMFERNKVDAVDHQGVAVEIVTDTGETIGGRLLVGAGRTLASVLNADGGFVELEPWGGERTLISKASLRTVKLVQATKPESLKGRIVAADGFDPHAILGVRPGVGLDEIKVAWHRLSMTYHPDRYASAELPAEVIEYLGAMARRINAAYTALESMLQPNRRAAGPGSEPIYTSRPRA